ncbi:hypothetical protein BH20VER2_BH20VER2_15520 [soil metagenome]
MKKLLLCSVGATFLAAGIVSTKAAATDGRVTRIVREVNLLPFDAAARPAALNDQVKEGVGVRTGGNARSELTFNDLTLTRLGANTIFSFTKAGRNVQLENGSVLLRVPRSSGGANIRGRAVTVAVTGTTLIVEANRAGRSKLMVLEGSARIALVRNRSQTRDLRAGQMLEVPAGATTLGQPVDIDLNDLMKKHPLITGFGPLPSRDLIAAAARDRGRRGPGDETVYQGQPVGGGRPPIVSVGLPFPGGGIPPRGPGGRNPGGTNDPGRPATGGAPNDPGGNTPPGGGRVPGGRTTGVGGVTTAPPSQSAGGNTGPILRRAPVRQPVPRATPPPIR